MAEQQRIVCAANRFSANEGQVILGVRHFDLLMRQGMKDANLFARDHHVQGFIDNWGNFHARANAWAIAEAAGQILYRCGGDTADGGILYSENLY